MKKLLLCLAICGISTHSSYSEKDMVYDILLHGDFLDTLDHLEAHDAIKIKEKLSRLVLQGSLFPGIDSLIHGENEAEGKSNQQKESEALRFLHELSEEHPGCRPFIKQGYTRFITRHNAQPEFSAHVKFPSKEIIDTYPDSFGEATGASIVLGPLLNPGKMTKAEYEKSVEAYEKSFTEKVKFFLLNRSNVLFPGTVKMLDAFFKKQFKDVFDEIKAPADPKELSKLNKDRDLAILKNFWQESIHNPGLLPFIVKGHANFVSAYNCKPPVRSIVLKNGLTLGEHANKNKTSAFAEVCNRLEPAPSSKFLRNTLILGVLGGIGYLAYKKYKAKTSMVTDTSKTHLA